MFKKLDADIVITFFFLPLALIVFLLVPNNETMLFGSYLTVTILLYELIIFNKRTIYGFSGLKKLSIPSLVLLAFTIFIAIPSIYIMNIKAHVAKYDYFISIIMFYILFPLGLLTGNIIKKIYSSKAHNLNNEKFIKSEFDKYSYNFLILLFSVCILIVLLYFTRSKTYPLFHLIQNPGSYVKIKLMRELALKILPVTFIEKYLFNWLRSLFFPFGIIGSLFLSVTYKKRKYKILFILFLVSGLFMNALTIEKSPTAVIILGMVSLFFLRLKKISIKFFLGSIITIFLFPVTIMYFLYHGKENLIRLVYISILNRMFIVPSESLYQYFEIFPRIHEFLIGRATQLFSWLHYDGLFPISNYVAKVWWNLPHTTGFANTNFVGNFWADFGWIGVLPSIYLIGIIIHLLYWKILSVSKYKKNIIYVTVISSIVPIFTFNFFSSNFTTLFFTRGLLFVVVFLIILSSKFQK